MDNIDLRKKSGASRAFPLGTALVSAAFALGRSFFDAAFKKRFERRYVYLDV